MRYDYPRRKKIETAAGGLICTGGMILLCVFSVKVLGGGSVSKMPVAALVLMLAGWTAAVLSLWVSLLGSRPIVVDDSGIKATLFSREWTSVAWRSITRIEQRRYYDPRAKNARTLFWIYGGRRKIRINDNIGRYRALIQDIDAQIGRRDVPAVIVDLIQNRRTRVTVFGGGAATPEQ